jgi:hypothetical protein
MKFGSGLSISFSLSLSYRHRRYHRGVRSADSVSDLSLLLIAIDVRIRHTYGFTCYLLNITSKLAISHLTFVTLHAVRCHVSILYITLFRLLRLSKCICTISSHSIRRSLAVRQSTCTSPGFDRSTRYRNVCVSA